MCPCRLPLHIVLDVTSRLRSISMTGLDCDSATLCESLATICNPGQAGNRYRGFRPDARAAHAPRALFSPVRRRISSSGHNTTSSRRMFAAVLSRRSGCRSTPRRVARPAALAVGRARLPRFHRLFLAKRHESYAAARAYCRHSLRGFPRGRTLRPTRLDNSAADAYDDLQMSVLDDELREGLLRWRVRHEVYAAMS